MKIVTNLILIHFKRLRLGAFSFSLLEVGSPPTVGVLG
jgi:hypothetical protein